MHPQPLGADDLRTELFRGGSRKRLVQRQADRHNRNVALRGRVLQKGTLREGNRGSDSVSQEAGVRNTHQNARGEEASVCRRQAALFRTSENECYSPST